MKLAIVSRHPAPYRDPLLRRFANDSRFETEVLNELSFDAGHDFWDLKEHGYDAKPLFGSSKRRFGRILHLIRRVVFGKYDFVLWAGFNTFELTVAVFLSALFRKHYGFMADTVEQRAINAFRLWVKRFIVRHAALILVPGKAGSKFWHETYGVPMEKICEGAYALDGEKMRNELAELRVRRDELRQKYGLGIDDTVYLMVANMIRTRYYPITSAAFGKFAALHPGNRFVMVGRGTDLEVMQQAARQNAALVVVPGCSFDEMKALYALADVYVHGGTEPASTALVIGAIAGLPLISSDAVGCSADVLRDGESGVKVADYLSKADWENGFLRLYEHRREWKMMGACADALSRDMDVDSVYGGIAKRVLGAMTK